MASSAAQAIWAGAAETLTPRRGGWLCRCRRGGALVMLRVWTRLTAKQERMDSCRT